MPKKKIKKNKSNIDSSHLYEDKDTYEDETEDSYVPKMKKKVSKKSKAPKKYFYIMISIGVIFCILILMILIKLIGKSKEVDIMNSKLDKEKLNLKKLQTILDNYESLTKIANLEQENRNKELETNKIKKEIDDFKAKVLDLFGDTKVGQEIIKERNNGVLNNKQPVERYEYKEGDLKDIKEYIEQCKNGKLLDNKSEDFAKRAEPKISIIIPVYNKQKSIVGILRSIQNQLFKDIEIIFVDDFSTDDTVKKIEEFQKEDQRIVLIKNDQNKGLFYSRNKAVSSSLGEYIQFLDANDFLVGNILQQAYKVAKEKNIDVVEYVMAKEEEGVIDKVVIRLNEYEDEVHQPKLNELLFADNRYLSQNYFLITNKLIRKKIFPQLLSAIGEEYLEERIDMHEDCISLYALYKVAESYLFIDQVGYYFIENKAFLRSLTPESTVVLNELFKSLFVQLKFFYKNFPDTQEGKERGYYFYIIIKRKYDYLSNFITKGFDFIIDVLDLYIHSPYYNFVAIENYRRFQGKIIEIKSKRNKLLIN